MTNKEALLAVLQVSVDDITLEKALIDNSIVSQAIYTAGSTEDIDKCAIPILEGLLTRGNVSEGGYSLSFDATAIKARLLALQEKYKIGNTYPKITSRAIW